MTTLDTVQVELIFSRPAHRSSADAIVPPESFRILEAARSRLRCATDWKHAQDPLSAERSPAFTPIQGGRIAMIERQNIQHRDRFLATIAFNEVMRDGEPQRQMWLADALPMA